MSIVPRSVLRAKVMQFATRPHEAGVNAVLPEACHICHDPVTFHPTNGVFNADSDRRDHTIGGFCQWGEFTSRRFFLRLDNGDPVAENALEAPLLRKTTPVRAGIAL